MSDYMKIIVVLYKIYMFKLV